MAVTAIWKVENRFDRLIEYAVNAKKTDAEIEKYHAIGDAIDYAADSGKTEKCFYVSGVNRLPENAKAAFAATQKRWGKTTGIVAFHMYQSFAQGEVDAKTAHEIGVKLAEGLFEERFEAIVATHLNTAHFHNHIVLNAVSYKDGKKYNDCKATYRLIRETSDRLCREYGLSVIRRPREKGLHYAEWKAEKEGRPTLRGGIRDAIDLAVRCSVSPRQFIDLMIEMGFIIDKSGKHAKIRHVGTERFVRFDSLGTGYTVEEIIDRVYENSKTSVIKLPPQDNPEQIFDGEQETVEEMPFVPLYRSYNRALHTAKERPYQNFRIYYLVRKDTGAMRLYEDSLDLVLGHNLKTGQDVIAYQVEAMRQIDENLRLRQEMRNTLKRAERAGNTVEAGKARYNIEVYSRRLSQLRHEVTTCDEVLERSRHVRNNLKRIEEKNFRGSYIPHKQKDKEYERK